jgi:hypothetical protein
MFLWQRIRWVSCLEHAWISHKALLHTEVCEVCGEPCEPQSSVITVCVPACRTASRHAFETKNAEPAIELKDSCCYKLVA